MLICRAENHNGRLAGVAGFEPAHMGVKVPCLRPLGDTPVCRLMQRCPAEPTCNLDQSRPRSSKRHFRLKHDLMIPCLHLVILMMDDLSGEFPFRLFTPKLRYRLYQPDDTAARCGGFIPSGEVIRWRAWAAWQNRTASGQLLVAALYQMPRVATLTQWPRRVGFIYNAPRLPQEGALADAAGI